MLFPFLLGCLLCAPMVSPERVSDSHSDEEPNTEGQQQQTMDVSALATELLEAERREERAYIDLDIARSRAGTTWSQHRKLTKPSRKTSVEKGRSHRIEVLKYSVAAEKHLSLEQPPPRETKIKCNRRSPYRTADGRCNNFQNPTWGMASTCMRRFLDPEYDDGISSPRTMSVIDGEFLPSARLVSTTVHPPSTAENEHPTFTHMLMQWGQFLDHDMTLAPMQELPEGSGATIPACCDSSGPIDRPQCFSIPIPLPDRRFTVNCMDVVRSVQVSNTEGLPVPVEQSNDLTSFLDGSQIYGSSLEEQRELRTGIMGQLKQRGNLLPEDTSEVPTCTTFDPPNLCFLAGDERVNENPTLQSTHTIFVREHNRIAQTLKSINKHWKDEKLFQEARKIVGAMLQQITYNEFLPLVLGPDIMSEFRLTLRSKGFADVYRIDTDASIRNAFGTAAFRMGHSMINSFLSTFDSSFNLLGSPSLRTTFGDTTFLLSNPATMVGQFFRGLVQDSAQDVDPLFTQEVTDFLFVDDEDNSFDLVSLNIQRGRDHGIPAYTKWREFCKVSAVETFDDLKDTHSASVIESLRSVYRHVADIDLFPGAITELPLPGGLLGPTFACLLGRQFQALREGDRFWFEGREPFVKFTPCQLEEIRKASLSRVICDNTNTDIIQEHAFIDGDRVPCDTLDQVNLEKWEE